MAGVAAGGSQATGHPTLSRNYDFPTGTLTEILGGEAQPGELPMTARPYVVETRPTDGGPACLFLCAYELLGGCIDGVNEEGLVVALLADDETTDRDPTLAPAVGLNEIQLLRYVLETCAGTAEAREALLAAKQHYMFLPCHFLVADASGDSFVWERTANAEHLVEGRGDVQVATNHLLLGLAQVALTAVVGLVAMAAVGTVDIPAARGGVVAWAVVWFVLGYAVYAVAYGTLGSLASRTEDAQTVAGPVIAVLLVGYFASFTAIGSPETGWATFLSYFPATAPMAMPNRIAMGAAAWWEPVVAVAVSVAAIDGLIRLGGRVYSGAVLHSGPTLKLRDAWRRTPGPGRPRGVALGLHRPAHR